MMEKEKEITNLKEELEKSKGIIKNLRRESSVLKKAIWDMLNYANIYVVLLDSDMIIRLINWSLATDLGYESEKDLIGKHWLQFVPKEMCDEVVEAHENLSDNKQLKKYRELTNNIRTLNGEFIPVKWFNVPINSIYHMTFSMGLKLKNLDIEVDNSVSEDSIRAYYRDIIEKDRTMIQSLKDVVLDGGDTCLQMDTGEK